MPTPSESPDPGPALNTWKPAAGNRRSVFGNYSPDPVETMDHAVASLSESLTAAPGAESLQAQIDLSVARAFLYRYLAKAYEHPSPDGWQWLTSPETQEQLRQVSEVAGLRLAFAALRSSMVRASFEEFLSAYLLGFGHAARGQCPLNEIEYADFKADPLFQPHQLADLAGFYRAFGLELAETADERHDHLCLELEFMCVLAAKEAYALEHQADPQELSTGREAQRKFLREHLGRWVPAFARRLAGLVPDSCLGDLARFTGALVEAECARAGVACGSRDLLLRPVDEAAESLCASCAVTHAAPAAAQPA